MRFKKYLIISATLILLLFVVVYLKILNAQAYIVSVPKENTPPADFEMLYGEFKLQMMITDQQKILTSDIWVDNKQKYFDSRPEDEGEWSDYYYIIEGRIQKYTGIGVDKYPEIHISKIHKIHKILFWSIIAMTLFCLILSFRVIIKKASANTRLGQEPESW